MTGSRFDAWLRRLIFAPESFGVPWLSRVFLFVFFWLREAHRGRVNVRAMALAYLLLFSLVPAAAVAASVFAGLPALAGSHEQFLSTVLGSIVPIDEQRIVGHVSRFTENAGKVGTVGGLLLVYFTINLARNMEKAVNELWQVKRRRPIIRSWSGMAFVVLVGAAVTALWIRTVAPWLGEAFGERARAGAPMALLGSFAVFFLFYSALPFTRVKIAAAAFGAAVAAVGWVSARGIFSTYAERLVNYDQIYGAMGVLALFLLWIYVSWLVALLGCVAARVIQDFRHLEDSERYRLGGERNHVFWALVILRELGAAFDKEAGEPPAVHDLATAAGQPASLFEELSERLVSHGLLVPWEGRPGCYVLARAPERIELFAVPRAVERDPYSVPELHGDRPLDGSEGEVATLLRLAADPEGSPLVSRTLRDLLGPATPAAVDPDPAGN